MNSPRNPKRLLRLSDPEISHDGQNLAFKIETADGTVTDIEIPAVEIGDVVQFLAESTEHFPPHTVAPIPAYLSPIPVRGVAFGAGHTPAESLLIVHLAGFDLAFALDSSKLSELAHEISRIALALSARTDSPH